MRQKKPDVYEYCDKAIRAMNRYNVREFGQFKATKPKDANVLRMVMELYRRSAKFARKRYYDEASEVFLLFLLLCEIDRMEAEKMVKETITMEWVDERLTETDVVTLYRFDSETERKAQRLAEALSGTKNRDAEIDKALRIWSKQLGQYAINFTDEAMKAAFKAAGVNIVEWVTQRDGRVCEECAALNGLMFPADDVPPKVHWNCRCYLRAVLQGK